VTRAKKAVGHGSQVWVSVALLIAGTIGLILEVPFTTPTFESLTPVSCGIPQAVEKIFRGGIRLHCTTSRQIIFTNGLTQVHDIVVDCTNRHGSLDLWIYEQPRAGDTHIVQASCNGQIVLPFTMGVNAFRTNVWLDIVFSAAAFLGGAISLALRCRRVFLRKSQDERADEHFV
jgi:hypothetical protein